MYITLLWCQNMWFDDRFEKNFRRLSNHFFNWDDVFEYPQEGQVLTYGPYYYGYEMTVGPDGKPKVREWGNTRPATSLASSDVRQPYVDTIFDKESQSLKLVAEMPGIEKSDIKVTVEGKTVDIKAERGDRKYHTRVPINHKVDENSAKAKYANGILELTIKLAEEKPKGKQVTVE